MRHLYTELVLTREKEKWLIVDIINLMRRINHIVSDQSQHVSFVIIVLSSTDSRAYIAHARSEPDSAAERHG